MSLKRDLAMLDRALRRRVMMGHTPTGGASLALTEQLKRAQDHFDAMRRKLKAEDDAGRMTRRTGRRYGAARRRVDALVAAARLEARARRRLADPSGEWW